MRRLDDFLIDRVFQKIADALHRHASCYAIAGFLMTGYGLSAVMAMVDWFVHDYIAAPVLLFVFMLFYPPFIIRAVRLERRWASGDNALPNDRITGCIQRTLALFWTAIPVPIDAMQLLAGLQLAAIFNLGWLLYLAGLYFLACTPKRPRRQTQRQLAWGSSR